MVFNSSYAHTDINVGDVRVVSGWKNEPPLVGELNSIVLELSKGDQPLVIDFRNVDVAIRYGGVIKTLSFEPTEHLGLYSSPIIPTRLGSYTVIVKGVVAGNNVDAEIPIEDVEDKQKLAFPDKSIESTEIRNIASQLQSSINQVQLIVEQMAGKINNAESSATEARKIAEDLGSDAERAYNFGIIGMGLGAAGIIVAIVSLTRKGKGEE
ncbi:MAG: hypothetical protein QXU32_04990 [Nitrososphaerales archaeon]